MTETRVSLRGEVASADFPAWLSRHAAKLGISLGARYETPESMEFTASGPDEMLHAFALAASLGPASVQVEEVRLTRGNSVIACY